MSACRRALLVAAVVLVGAAAALALVNPQLQPSHLVSRHKAVIGGEITQADAAKGAVVFRVTRVCMGEFAAKKVTIQAPDAPAGEPSLYDDAGAGGTVVAYVGKTRKGHEGDVLLYAGHQWHEARMLDIANPAAWKWSAALGDEMVGTFNGAAEQLLALMADAADKRDYFPAYPTVKFKDVLVVGAFAGGPIRGVALYDLDGDGRHDLYACHASGNRAFIQTAPLKFEDRTARLGLDGVKSASCSFADVNADGLPDLLADGVIYLGSKDGFRRSDLLPAGANRDVKCAAFVEVNGDGYPDVLVSRVRGGLALYLNPGAKGGTFTDVTAAAGLDRPEAGAGETGFFAPGDWNGDGRVDLYYAAAKGFFLVQDAQGRFTPLAHRLDFDYKVAGTGDAGLTGAGCFAALWRPDTWDLAAAGDMHLMIVTLMGGVPTSVTRYANEVKVCRVSQLATLAEDLDMDGYVDLLTLTRDADVRPIYHANRGYGSFMLPELYPNIEAFPGKAWATGAWGAAAGDVDGDSVTDLVLGGADGVLRVVVSDALAHPLRQPKENPTPMEEKLCNTRLLAVKVAGKVGVLGADVRLADAAGRLVGRRVIGSQVLTGCRGPDAINLAVREPGEYTLSVRFSDGATRTWPVDLRTEKRAVVTASRDAGPRSAEKALKWTIGPASPEALLVRKTAEPITIDGKLDESFWSPAEKVARKVQGSPTATATLSIVWTDKSSISKSGCLYVAVKVLDGPAGKTPKDAVEVFLDALHNREVIYNADDMHFIVGRDGKSRSLKGKPNWFLKTAAAEIEGGYIIEMAIPTNYWHGEGSWVDFGAKAVYGFDIAVDEGGKEVGRQVWRGTEKNPEDTSGFGSIVLTAEPAGQKTSDAPAPKK